MKVYTKEGIKELLENNDKAVCRGIVAIYERQTEDEKSSEETLYVNNMGFNAFDASYGTYLAEYMITTKRSLSGDFLAKGRRMILKYASQLAKIANLKQSIYAVGEYVFFNEGAMGWILEKEKDEVRLGGQGSVSGIGVIYEVDTEGAVSPEEVVYKVILSCGAKVQINFDFKILTGNEILKLVEPRKVDDFKHAVRKGASSKKLITSDYFVA